MGMAYTTNEKIGQVRARAVRMVRSGKSTREVARHFGYAQSTIVKWCRRAPERFGRNGILETRSSRPHTCPNQTPREIGARIIAVRQESKRCAEVVHRILQKEGVFVFLSTVKRVLSRYGCLKKRSPWKKRRRYPICPDVAQKGDLVQFDTIHFVNKNQRRTYVYTALDVYSRYGFALTTKRANRWQSVRFFKKACQYFPFDMKCIQTDNGPEFGLHFTDAVQRAGMTHQHIHPRSPNENGHLERFNRTIQEEMMKHCKSIHNAKSVAWYLEYYNTKRMHMGINYQTPEEMTQE